MPRKSIEFRDIGCASQPTNTERNAKQKVDGKVQGEGNVSLLSKNKLSKKLVNLQAPIAHNLLVHKMAIYQLRTCASASPAPRRRLLRAMSI